MDKLWIMVVMLACITAAGQEKRVALVIGNAAYNEKMWGRLANPKNDAQGMAQALRDIGFTTVTLLTDAKKEEMENAVREFGDSLPGSEVGLFYYAGHGMQVKDINYLIPLASGIEREWEVPSRAVDVSLILSAMEYAGAGTNILILDACRNNTLPRSGGRARGLAQMDAPGGTIIVFATAAGKEAKDGEGEHSPFTESLLKHIKTPGLEIDPLLTQVRNEVREATGGEQMPWKWDAKLKPFYFVKGEPKAPEVSMPTERTKAELIKPGKIEGRLPSGASHWYRVSLSERRSLTARLCFAHAKGDLDLELYEGESALATAATQADEEVVSVDVGPGVAYLKVSGYRQAGNDYRLVLELGAPAAVEFMIRKAVAEDKKKQEKGRFAVGEEVAVHVWWEVTRGGREKEGEVVVTGEGIAEARKRVKEGAEFGRWNSRVPLTLTRESGEFAAEVEVRIGTYSRKSEVNFIVERAITGSDVSVTWSGPERVRSGEEVRYALRVSQSYPGKVSDLTVRVKLPAGLSYQGKSGVPLSWTVTAEEGTLDYDLTASQAGEQRQALAVYAGERELLRRELTTQVEKRPEVSSWSGFTYLREATYSCGGRSYKVKEYRHEKTGMEFVLVPGGSFEMGSNEYDGEKPVHEVEVSPFMMSKSEVTQGVWKRVMGTEPWKEGGKLKDYVREGEDYPAVYVSWDDCQNFCRRAGLSLPSEAQWEYACRGGTRTKYYWGDSEDGSYMWYYANAWNVGEKYAHQVKQKKPNAYGLYDMSGNVWEWCEDAWHDNYQGAPVDGSAWTDASASVNWSTAQQPRTKTTAIPPPKQC